MDNKFEPSEAFLNVDEKVRVIADLDINYGLNIDNEAIVKENEVLLYNRDSQNKRKYYNQTEIQSLTGKDFDLVSYLAALIDLTNVRFEEWNNNNYNKRLGILKQDMPVVICFSRLVAKRCIEKHKKGQPIDINIADCAEKTTYLLSDAEKELKKDQSYQMPHITSDTTRLLRNCLSRHTFDIVINRELKRNGFELVSSTRNLQTGEVKDTVNGQAFSLSSIVQPANSLSNN